MVFKNKKDGRILETSSVLFGDWEEVKPEENKETEETKETEESKKGVKKDSKK